MKTHAGMKFKKWLSGRGIKISFAAKKMGISYSHLLNWMEGRFGLSPQAGKRVEAFTNGEIKMTACIAPSLPRGPLYVWGKGKRRAKIKNPKAL